MNRPIDQYTAAQLASFVREDYPQATTGLVGEWLCVPVMALIALVGGLLMGLKL